MSSHTGYIPLRGNRIKRAVLTMDQQPGHGLQDHDHAACGHAHAAAAASVLDPVCGMTVDPHSAKHQYPYKGRSYFFCSARCRTKFAADPEKFLGKDARAAEPLPQGTIYTC